MKPKLKTSNETAATSDNLSFPAGADSAANARALLALPSESRLRCVDHVCASAWGGRLRPASRAACAATCRCGDRSWSSSDAVPHPSVPRFFDCESSLPPLSMYSSPTREAEMSMSESESRLRRRSECRGDHQLAERLAHPLAQLLHVLLRHRLPPLLGESFGGGTGLVDLRGRKASDRASHTEVDPSLALSNMAVAASRTPVLNHHCKHNPTAEVTDLLELEVQFLVGPEPVLKEATDRRSTLDELRPPVQDRIFGDAAHHPVEITAIQSLKLLAHKLNRVGRRGLLRHRPRSIPQAQDSA